MNTCISTISRLIKVPHTKESVPCKLYFIPQVAKYE